MIPQAPGFGLFTMVEGLGPQVQDLSLLPTTVSPDGSAPHHESWNRELRYKLNCLAPALTARLSLLVDNNVQAPLVPCVLIAAVDLPLPQNTKPEENDQQSKYISPGVSQQLRLRPLDAMSSASGQLLTYSD